MEQARRLVLLTPSQSPSQPPASSYLSTLRAARPRLCRHLWPCLRPSALRLRGRPGRLAPETLISSGIWYPAYPFGTSWHPTAHTSSSADTKYYTLSSCTGDHHHQLLSGLRSPNNIGARTRPRAVYLSQLPGSFPSWTCSSKQFSSTKKKRVEGAKSFQGSQNCIRLARYIGGGIHKFLIVTSFIKKRTTYGHTKHTSQLLK